MCLSLSLCWVRTQLPCGWEVVKAMGDSPIALSRGAVWDSEEQDLDVGICRLGKYRLLEAQLRLEVFPVWAVFLLGGRVWGTTFLESSVDHKKQNCLSIPPPKGFIWGGKKGLQSSVQRHGESHVCTALDEDGGVLYRGEKEVKWGELLIPQSSVINSEFFLEGSPADREWELLP